MNVGGMNLEERGQLHSDLLGDMAGLALHQVQRIEEGPALGRELRHVRFDLRPDLTRNPRRSIRAEGLRTLRMVCVLAHHSRAPFFHSYIRPITSGTVKTTMAP